MDEVINKIIYTLEKIEVHGVDNMSRLLGCIQALNQMKEAKTDESNK